MCRRNGCTPALWTRERTVGAGVAAAGGGGDYAGTVVVDTAEEDAAAFVRVGFFAVAAEGVVIGAREFQHGGKRFQIGDFRFQIMGRGETISICNLKSSINNRLSCPRLDIRPDPY